MHYNHSSAIIILKGELGTGRAQSRVMFSMIALGMN